jgi:hypothetical protein
MNDSSSLITADPQYGLPTTGMAPGLALLFNDRLYDRCKDVARIMAEAKGFTPPHLIGNQHACFGVVQMSITWRLTPQMVAASTYATPGGKIGYEGKLVQAILENSGHLEGGVTYELFGDWDRLRGRHKKAQSPRGGEYYVSDWKPEEEKGLGVFVRAKVRGEEQPRELEFFLSSAWPRNSTLWALRPDHQIKYTACRAFANTVAPGIFMGVPFDGDADQGMMIDVTPQRPQRSDFDAPQPLVQADETATEQVNQETGEITEEAEHPELSPADAYQMGGEARDKGFALKAVPPEWRDDEHHALADAWSDGWRARDEEIRAALKGK